MTVLSKHDLAFHLDEHQRSNPGATALLRYRWFADQLLLWEEFGERAMAFFWSMPEDMPLEAVISLIDCNTEVQVMERLWDLQPSTRGERSEYELRCELKGIPYDWDGAFRSPQAQG